MYWMVGCTGAGTGMYWIVGCTGAGAAGACVRRGLCTTIASAAAAATDASGLLVWQSPHSPGAPTEPGAPTRPGGPGGPAITTAVTWRSVAFNG